MKRMTCAVLSLLMVFCFCVPMSALDGPQGSGSTVVTAEVPAAHRITVSTDGGASVIFRGRPVTGFDAQRLGTPEITVRAESGYTVKSILLGGADITEKFAGGVYTFDPVCQAQTLTVVTEKAAVPANITRYTINGIITYHGKPLSGVTLELRSELKTDVTGSDSKFSFSKVEAGHHSLTALQDGTIVGYMEFELISGGKIDLTHSDGIFSIAVPDGTAAIHLVLERNSDGRIGVTDVQVQKDSEKPGNSPQTGDTGNRLWITLLLIFGSLLTLVITGRKRRKGKVICKTK